MTKDYSPSALKVFTIGGIAIVSVVGAVVTGYNVHVDTEFRLSIPTLTDGEKMKLLDRDALRLWCRAPEEKQGYVVWPARPDEARRVLLTRQRNGDCILVLPPHRPCRMIGGMVPVCD